MNMILNKRYIILAALVVALGAAIFLNWKFAQPGGFGVMGTGGSNLGDAAYVANHNVSGSKTDFFAQARLTRSQTRDQAQETLNSLTSNPSATSVEKQKATDELTQIAGNITQEGQIETLIKAKGFSDCVCIINDGSATIVVKPKSASGITQNDAVQIKDIVVSEAKVSADNIKIISEN